MELEFIKSSLPLLIDGTIVTIKLTILTFLFGSIIGIINAILNMSKYKIIRIVAFLYIWIIRGTPLLLQLFIIYFGLPSIGIKLSPMVSGTVALSVNCGAYMSEMIRGGIQAIDKGQFEAARSLGMTYLKAMRYVIMPQAIRVIIPSIGNEIITINKETSIVSTITIVELMRNGQVISTTTFKVMESYILVGVFYLLMTTILTILFKKLEKKLAY